VVRSGVDLSELVTQLRKAGAPEAGQAWAVVESYACTGQPGVPQTKVQYEEYLGGLIAHGAKVVNVYGWNADSGPYAIKGSGVIPTVKTWLSGERLPATWFRSVEDMQQGAAIDAKLTKLQRIAHELVDGGRDPHLIKPVFESLQSEIDPLVKAGKITEAGAAIDRAISRLQALRY